MTRLLRRVEIVDGARSVRIQQEGAAASTVSIAAGTYWVSGDGEAGDLLAAVAAAITAGTTGLAVSALAVGPGVADSTRAQGRARWLNAEDGETDYVDLLLADALTTLPEGLLGFAHAATVRLPSDTAVYSDGPARASWYPQAVASFAGKHRRRWSETVGIRGSVAVDTLPWGRYEVAEARWATGILAPFIRRDAGAESDWQSMVGLGSDPRWASWEAFCEDIQDAQGAGDSREEFWRLYPDALSASFLGPYRWTDTFEAWWDPLAAARETSAPGLQYGLDIPGQADL